MRVDVEPRPYRSCLLSIRRSHPPVTLPTFYNKYAFKDTVFHLYEVNVLFSPNFKIGINKLKIMHFGRGCVKRIRLLKYVEAGVAALDVLGVGIGFMFFFGHSDSDFR